MPPAPAAVDPEIDDAQSELAQVLGERYTVRKVLGRGGAGIAFLIEDTATGLLRVAKILRPSVRMLEDLVREFKGEAQRLASLRHPNLVTVFEQSRPDATPYFIMEFVSGARLDEAIAQRAKLQPGGRWLETLRQVLVRLTDVLAYLHSQSPKPLLHLDIKPENVLLGYDYVGDPLPVLLDFGISRFAAAPGEDVKETHAFGTFPMWPGAYLHTVRRMTTPGRAVFVIDRHNLNIDLDLHLLGRTLKLVLDSGIEADGEPLQRWTPPLKAEHRFLKQIIERLDIDRAHPAKFARAPDLLQALRRVALRVSRARGRFDYGVVKIPGVMVRNLGSNVRKLTDWPRFQRLRGIHQLGFTHLIYPGAVHTRFEHSLGVFENALRVLDQITGASGDSRFRALVSDEELAATALVGLYHDIGHYPFAHQFRFRGTFPKHEERTLELIKSSDVEKLVSASFGPAVYAAMVGLMASVVAYEEPTSRKPGTPTVPDHFRVLRAVVSSTIDADKLDYVWRDAYHAGVPYGLIVDRDRFLSSLRVWWDADGKPKLLLSDKGRVCAEALVFARYLMTSEVYWNHAVRAYGAMLSAATDQMDTTEVEDHLWDTDFEFLQWLVDDKRTSWLGEAIARRQPYRRALVHQVLGGRETAVETDERLFRLLERGAKNDAPVLEAIRRAVRTALAIGEARDYEIVVDVPAGMTRLRGVQVLPEGHEEPGRVGPIYDAIGENFDGFARKARVFVHPRLMEGWSVPEATASVRRALSEEFQLD